MPACAHDFIHPDDKAALENLQALPLFPQCCKAFMNIGVEHLVNGQNLSNKIRLGPDQLPEIYNLLPPICGKLGIVVPDLYLEMDPSPNSYTMGDSRVFVTITSSLVQNLEENELRAVLAHECGHIVCHHVLYHTMATMLTMYGGAILGLAAPIIRPIQLALSYWSRRSELSADRASAVVMGGAHPMVDTLIRISGGPKAITDKVNLEAYLQQADDYDKLQGSHWDKMLQSLAIMDLDHPFPTVRAREITRWCASEEFHRIQRGLGDESSTLKCAKCGATIAEDWKFCRKCGQALR